MNNPTKLNLYRPADRSSSEIILLVYQTNCKINVVMLFKNTNEPLVHTMMSQWALHVNRCHQQIKSNWRSSAAQDVIHTGSKCVMASKRCKYTAAIVRIKHVSACRSRSVENKFSAISAMSEKHVETWILLGAKEKHVETWILLWAKEACWNRNTVGSEGSMLKQEYCWERSRQVEKGSSIYRPHIRLGCSLAVIRWILFFNNNIFSQQKWSVRCSCRRADRKIKGSFYF